MMKAKLIVCTALLVCTLGLHAASSDVRVARELARRIVPQWAGQIHFESLAHDGTADRFELEQDETSDGIVIRGNSAIAMAVGLNHYLKYYAHTSVSWYKDDPVELPQGRLPKVTEKVGRVARVPKRFFLNYCTFGYTMPWWQWDDWERFIDWMALQGINMPLAITGQEAVWYGVWRKLGLSDTDIRNYFTGPAHLPWHRMGNIDHFQGGLPDSWLKHQADLQKHILKRERELGMTPVLPAFAGHVPQALQKVFPDAKITRMSSWGGFDDAYRAYFLDPMDPLFSKIQKLFLTEQKRLYGSDHVYGIDPFNEMEAPSWEPEYLARVSRQIYGSLTQCDPEATWLQMTWLFYFDRQHWTNERINAYQNAVPQNRMILLDYFAENTEVWKSTESYFGQPFLWCYLGNFGGNTMLCGNLEETGRRIENVIAHGGTNFQGVGSTLEGFDVNPMMYEYVFEKAWSSPLPDRKWIEAWADRRLGRSDEGNRLAWLEMLDKVYTRTASLGQGTLTNARPSLTGNGNWTTNPTYNYPNADLMRIWEAMLKAAEQNQDVRQSMLYDLVNVGRQVLGNHFMTLRDHFTNAYRRRDELSLNRYGRRMLELLTDMDRLLSCHNSFLAGKWMDDAARFATSPEEEAYYLRNARTLITTWGERGQSLNDYANRSLAGLTDGYYKPRWEMFITEVCRAVEKGRPFDEKSFHTRVLDFEQHFADNDFRSPTRPSDAGLLLIRQLVDKYHDAVLNN